MKTEIADELRKQLSQLPLGTTQGSRTEHAGRDLAPGEVREALRAHDRAVGLLITDAVHRRRDVQDLVDWRHGLLPLEESEPPDLRGVWTGLAVVVGASLALHACELAAIAWLLWL